METSVSHWIDTHAHLNDEEFSGRVDAVLATANEAGVIAVLVVGVDRTSSARPVELANTDSRLFAVCGFQPNHLDEISDGDWEIVAEISKADRVVAIGETGLDRYWNKVPFERQKDYFRRSLALADKLSKPVVIHCRQAEEDVVVTLREYSRHTGRPIAGVMHSFTGDLATAIACLELGLHLSFAGMVTFKKSEALRDVARATPLDRLLVETDSPYLSPEPLRGKRNQPANVAYTGACLAKVKNISVSEFATATTQNARRLFRLPL